MTVGKQVIHSQRKRMWHQAVLINPLLHRGTATCTVLVYVFACSLFSVAIYADICSLGSSHLPASSWQQAIVMQIKMNLRIDNGQMHSLFALRWACLSGQLGQQAQWRHTRARWVQYAELKSAHKRKNHIQEQYATLIFASSFERLVSSYYSRLKLMYRPTVPWGTSDCPFGSTFILHSN